MDYTPHQTQYLQSINIILNMGQNRHLFVYLRSFLNTMTNLTIKA